MTLEHQSPCVGCRFAHWAESVPEVGRCDHPQAIAYRERPMVLRSYDRSYSTTIRRTELFEPPPDACPAREA